MNFTALQHSVFLQALGIAILNSLWQAFILWLLYETISAFHKNASAKFKNNLSTILLFFSFVWFIIGFVSKVINNQTPISINATATNTEGVTTAHIASTYQQFLSYAGSSLPYLSIAYIFLLFFLIAKLFTAYRYVYIISNKRLLNPPGELQAFANKVARQMKITRKISVWISNYIDVPATIGFIKPVILIPFASLNNLSTDQLEAIILHELSHIKRNDYVINIIVAVIETILFFNPFVVLLSKIIKRERENCCDDFVLQYKYDPHSYASALLRLEQSRISKLKLAIGAVSGENQLLSRIKRITNNNAAARQFNYGQKLLALLLITAIICSLAWLAPSNKKIVLNNIHLKKIENITIVKYNAAHNYFNLPAAQKESLQSKNLKHISKKNEFLSLKETVESAFNKLNINEDIPSVYNENSLPPMNLNSPKFLFDESKLNIPKSINIKNFPFQNTNFNIDLSKIDMSQLNENLKQAYKEINNINWTEVQDNIRESFSKMKVSDFPSKKQFEFFIEKAKELSKIQGENQEFDKRFLIKKLNKEIQLQDSLNFKRKILIYNKKAGIQREYQRLQNHSAEDMSTNTYFNYSGSKASEKNIPDKNLLQAEPKNIKISVKHFPKPNDIHQKKILQFSFDNDIKKGSQNVINIEVTDLP